MSPLPPILYRPPQPAVPGDVSLMRRPEQRRIANTWLERGRGSKLPVDVLTEELERAFRDRATAARVLAALRDRERDVLGVYARHGGTLNGRVAFLELLARDLIPLVPAQGSAGASGDLAPLAHFSAAMLGVGEALLAGERMPAAAALARAGLAPIALGPKEGLALINGTQLSTAAALAGLFARHSAEERESLLLVLNGRRTQAFELDLVRFVETRGWFEGTDLDQSRRLAAPVSVFADEALARRWKKTRNRARGLKKLSVAERHELRKELKKLRYTFEFFGPLYEPKRTARLARRLEALQDIFGDLNDAAMLRRLLTDPAFAPAADPELQRAVGWILGATQLRADIAWAEAAGLWRRLKRSRRFWR